MKAADARQVFFLSDGTGLTASSYGKSLLAQFQSVDFDAKTIPFVDSLERAHMVSAEIQASQVRKGTRAIVFSTLVDEEIQECIESSGAFVIDIFHAFIGPLEHELERESAHTLGQSSHVLDDSRYQKRIDAIEFALAHDDGVRPDHYEQADVILTGVSRCGKTPTSLYLAMNFSLKACNYPLTDEELERDTLPGSLRPWRDKLIGLTINPGVLQRIREKRRASAQYCSLAVCSREVKAAERLFSEAGIPVFDSTATSIEELAGSILKFIRQSGRVNES